MTSRMESAGRLRWIVFGAVICASPLAVGCGRELTIYRDDVINTEFDRNGVPMDVDIVMVYPSDFKGDLMEINRDLLADSSITSDMWFKNKPTRDSAKDPEDHAHYRIPSDRIFSFAEKKEEAYGKYLGGQLQGAKYSKKGEKEIIVRNIPVADIWNERSILYVFGRFTDAKGAVLPTKPAKFWKIGRYKEELAIRIRGKSIDVMTDATFNKDADNKGQVD